MYVSKSNQLKFRKQRRSAHGAAGGVVQALQQRHQRALAAAAKAHQRDHAPRLQRQADAAQREDLLPPRVPELHVPEKHLSHVHEDYVRRPLQKNAPVIIRDVL